MTLKEATRLHITLGEQVIVNTRFDSREGRVTQVTSNQVFIRFPNTTKDAMFDRRSTSIVPVAFLDAMREVDEDEANAAAFRDHR